MPDKVKKVVGLGLVIGASFFGGPAAAALAMKLVGASLIASGSKPKPTSSTTNGTELQLSGDPVDVRSVCYGEAWTAGTLRYRNTTGTDNKDLYMVVVLAGHEIDSVQAVEADRQTLTLDGSGNVTSPSKWAGLMNVRFYTGSDSQTADSTLDSTFTNWTTDHRLRGLAYAVIKLTFNEESLNSPPAFRFKVRGKKVYDPRLDSTNGGSGSHRLATPSTWAWSRNPVLCANDFLRGVKVNSINIAGMGLASTRFDWANVIAEANVCEENVALAAGGNEDRYTCDGFIDPRQPMGEILRHFEMAIAGDIIPSDGKWRFFCGAYRTPTLSLTDQHFIGPIRYNVHKGELERYDTAEGRYAALAESGTVVNYSPVRLSTATTGSERLLSIDFQLVADTADSGYDGGARPQRLAKLLLEKDAAGKRIQCRTNLYGLRCVPGETVQITHAAFGLTTQAMRVLEVQLVTIDVDGKQGLAVDLTLEAGPSSLYSWSAEESALSPAPSIPQAGPGRGIIEGLLISDPYFNRRGELWDGSGESDSYYWRKSGDPSSTGAGVSIDLTGGSNDDVGALVLSTNGSTIDWSRALAVGKATAQTIIRGEQVAFKIRLRRTTSVPTGDLNKVFYVDIGRGDGDGFVGEYDSAPGFRLLHADLAALTLNQWYEYEWVSRLGEVGTADLHPEYNRCAIEIALTSGDAMTIEVDSITPHRIGTAKQIGLILQPKTAAETSAGVTPTYYEYEPGDIRRYGAAGDGSTSDYSAWVSAALVGGKILIPANFNSAIASASLGSAGIALITGTTIRGADRGTSKITVTGSTACNLFRATNKKNIAIENVTLRQNGVNTSSALGMFLYWEQTTGASQNGGNLELYRVRFENCKGDNWVGVFNDSATYDAVRFVYTECEAVSESGNAREPTTSGVSSSVFRFNDYTTTTTRTVSDIEISGTIVDGTNIKQFVEIYQSVARAEIHHNICRGFHSAAAFSAEDVGLYVMMVYSGPSGTAPDKINFSDNIIEGCVDCGLYALGANRVSWNNNIVTGQTGTTDGTLAKGAAVFSVCTNASASGNVYDSCARACEVVLTTGSVVKLADEKVTNPVNSAISFKATAFAGTSTGKLYVDGYVIEAGGTGTRGMDFDFGSTYAASVLSLRNLDIEAATDGIRFLRGNSTTPAMGTVTLENFRINGPTNTGITTKNYSSSSQRFSIRHGTIENITSTGYGAEFDSSYLDVFDVLFSDIGTSAFGLSTSGMTGTLAGIRYQNTLDADRIRNSGGTDLGRSTPTHSGNIGDFVQNVAVADRDGSNMLLDGWQNYNGSTGWRTRYTSTVSPAT